MRPSVRLALTLSLAVLGGSATAIASQPFPAEVAAQVPSLGCVPQCTLCHFQNPGMAPAAQAFAMTLKAQAGPVLPQNTASLDEALAKLKTITPPPDSDGDGTPDYTELENGTNPNLADPSATLCGVGPQYGCGATIAAKSRTRTGSDTTATLAATFTLLTGLLLLRRRGTR